MRQINKLLLLTVMMSLLASCVTQKKRGEVSALGKLYHNTTAKYNGYFNANELLIASIEKLEEEHKDNFKQILPVYEYAAVANPEVVAADLDKAIEKVSVVVNLHRVSQWTDDCYLLLGKAQYLKQDYESAEETLRYMVDQFSPEKMAERAKKASGKSARDKSSSNRSAGSEPDFNQLSEKEQRRLLKQREKERKRYNRELKKKRKQSKKKRKKRKEDEKPEATPQDQEVAAEGQIPAPEENKEEEDRKSRKDQKDEAKADTPEPESDNYFLKHRPAYQEGVLWLARAYVERERYEEAQRLIAQLEGDSRTFDDIRASLPPVKAYYHLHRGETEPALAQLEEAIATSGNRKEKARYSFIVAQIHNRAGRKGDAYAAYDRALKFGPTYEMEFSARLALVESGWRSGTLSRSEAQDRLEKMLKDSKNIDYQDQVYYALAEMELDGGDRGEGIRLLEQSLASSSQNQLQKSESYLRLANLYLEEENFIRAQRYFDSTLTVLPSTDERYPEVERWRNNLTDIATNLETIAYQDSLLRIAALSEAEQKALALNIKRRRDEERRQALVQQTAAPGQQSGGLNNSRFANNPATTSLAPVPGGGNQANESSFFAYNDRDLKRGRRDFQRVWGLRNLEDDWRRGSKQGGDAFAAAGAEVAPAALPEDELSEILSEVPATEGDKLAAQIKIQEAMFNLGVLYRERLGDNEKSVAVLEELNTRFDRSSYQLDSWYYLYLAYQDLKQPDKARQYDDLIQERYPSSAYAKVLRNPNYAAEVRAEENKLNRYYDDAYLAFSNGNYQEAFRRTTEASSLFGAQNPLQPKFALLGAMSTGNLQGREAYINSLNDLIARYPNTAEEKQAREILRLLGERGASLPGGAREVSSEFKVTDDQMHYVLIAFQEDMGLNDSKVSVSNYNLKYHKLEKLRISNIYLGTEAETRVPILVIRRFKDKAEAMAYYEGIQRNKKEFIDPSVDFEVFAVSQDNYREVIRSKSVESYRGFFSEHYLQ